MSSTTTTGNNHGGGNHGGGGGNHGGGNDGGGPPDPIHYLRRGGSFSSPDPIRSLRQINLSDLPTIETSTDVEMKTKKTTTNRTTTNRTTTTTMKRDPLRQVDSHDDDDSFFRLDANASANANASADIQNAQDAPSSQDPQQQQQKPLPLPLVVDGPTNPSDPPARCRPADGQWPQRDKLSFTRSLIFYGEGAVTSEHEQACRYIRTSRALRKKYHGGGATVVHVDVDVTGSIPSRNQNGQTYHDNDDDDDDDKKKESIDETSEAEPSEASALSSAAFSFKKPTEGVKQEEEEEEEGGGGHRRNGGDGDGDGDDSSPPPQPPKTNHQQHHQQKQQQQQQQLTYEFGRDGVVQIFDDNSDPDHGRNLVTVPSIDEFMTDYNQLRMMVSDGAMRSYCFQRLQLLSTSFKMHHIANSSVEGQEQSQLLGTDFYRIVKVDNHIHAAAAPSAKYFVSFVKSKLETEPNEVVSENGETLSEVFRKAGIDSEHLTIDAFNVLADYSVYQRFDNFNSKYSPFRMADMRRIFLKTNNCMGGRYFAELIKGVFSRHEASKGHRSACELRLSIYGMERHEWHDLANWMLRDWEGGDYPGPVLSSHNRWMIQFPRLWRIFRRKKQSDEKEQKRERSFQDMLDNIFIPIFDATLHPEEHPEVAELLKNIVGFDSVDDEGAHEASNTNERPREWTNESNPSYWWQLYYLWANLEVLNKLRSGLNLNTIAFRPHAGETGDAMHLAATYLLCPSINHGINLHNQVSLQYLYYLDQIGLSVSPLSNNFLFRKIATNPFPKLFRRGLNVTLSTDDPLLFHMSDDALLEEYAVARASFDLSMTDVSEIARNSVLQSGFEESLKRRWLGVDYRRGVTFCDEKRTHVPLIRAKYRAEHLAIEHMMVHLLAAGKGAAVLNEMKTQFGLARDGHRDVLFDNLDEVPPFPEQAQL